MIGKQLVFFALSTLLAVASVRAEILVDHQPHPYGGLASDTLFNDPFGRPVWQRVADNFVLPNPAQAVSLRYWGFYDADNPPATETMRIRIYGSRAGDGLPDDANILSETTLQNPTRTATGRLVSTGHLPHEYLFDAGLAVPVDLDAGTAYWLEVAQIGDVATSFRWEFSIDVQDGAATINSIHDYWQDTFPGLGADAAFQLISPEPCCLALFGLGLFLRARRR